jgi:DNA-binding beta-propeller fold protein YncE
VQSIEYWAIPREGSRIPAPRNVAIGPNGTIYALDNAARVLVYDADSGECRAQWYMPEGEAGNPEGLCLLADGRLAVADTHYHRIVFFTQQGELSEMWGRQGDEPGQFFWPVGIAQDNAGYLYVSEYGGEQRVQKLTVDGEFVLQFGGSGAEPGRFQRPSGVAWHRGKVYVADAINNRIQVFSENGEFLEVFASSPKAPDLQYPYDLCPGPADDLFVVEYRAGRVTRFGLDGRLLGRFGKTGRGEGEFSTPWGLTVDAQGRVIVADTGNRRIVELRL